MHGNDDVLSINMNLIVTSPVLHHTNTVGLMLDANRAPDRYEKERLVEFRSTMIRWSVRSMLAKHN